MKRRLAIWGLGLMLAGTAWAWRPSGWVYHDHPWAYDSASGDWMWFNPDTQWVVNMNSGAWATLPGSALATGWVFYQWPYGYAQGNGAWHWINEPDVQWVVNMDTSEWTRFGIPEAPGGMVWIPGGTNAGTDPDGGPAYSLTVDSFFMDRCEVTKGQWDEVVGWNGGNGYVYDHPGGGKGAGHPVQSVSWYDVLKWCNARSEMEGRTPVYYRDAAFTQVIKTNAVVTPYVKSNAAGFRLPTKTEWEYAARGGLEGKRFPRGDTISHAEANYHAIIGAWDYDLTGAGGYGGWHPDYDDEPLPYTSPAGSFPTNGFGLCDMAGNVWELCWTPGNTARLIRGGSCHADANNSRIAYTGTISQGGTNHVVGFRTVVSIP